MDFFPIIVGHYLQILKEATGLGHGLAMAANIHKRPLDIVSLLMKEHTTTYRLPKGIESQSGKLSGSSCQFPRNAEDREIR